MRNNPFSPGCVLLFTTFLLTTTAIAGNDRGLPSEAVFPESCVESEHETVVTNLIAAHVTGGMGWKTRLSVGNLSSTASSSLRFDAYNQTGQLIESKTVSPIVKLGRFSASADELFSVNTLQQDFWVMVVSNGPVMGTLDFGTTDGLAWTSLPMPKTGSTELYFPYVYETNDSLYYTGITLVNLEEATASIRMEGYSENGTKMGEYSVVMPSHGKIVRLVSQIFPGGLSSSIRQVKVSSDKRLAGFELFGRWDVKGLAGLPAIQGSVAGHPASNGDHGVMSEDRTLYYTETPKNVDYYTGVTFTNLSSSAFAATVEIFNQQGDRFGMKTWDLAPYQQVTREIWDSAGTEPHPFPAWMKVTAPGRLAGFELMLTRIGNYRFEGVSARSAAQTIAFPSVFITPTSVYIRVINPGPETVTGVLIGTQYMNNEDSFPFQVDTYTFEIPPHRIIFSREQMSPLFHIMQSSSPVLADIYQVSPDGQNLVILEGQPVE
ncbi:MAG: hypothetical protein KA419_17255 [Acidobacteria bacterium]|nr:hypothetical protein [Acidobacteriota bacterium]